MTTTNAGVSPAVPLERQLASVLAADERPTRPNGLSASFTLAWRAAVKLKHTAVEQLIDLLMMPVIFLLIFNYLFGGAFAGSVDNYLQYFVPGVLVMTAVMLTTHTGTAIARDISKGIFERFRTMPFWQPASLIGTMITDLGRYLLALVLTTGLGLLLGFRPDAGIGGVLLAFALILVFAFAFAWVFTALGLTVRSPESVQSASMLLMALVFCSNIFVSSATMPGWIGAVVDVNPISHVSTAARGLLHGTVTAGQIGLVALSTAILVGIFAPLTMFLYHKKKNV
ncbi:ABC transporter permease [Amycolatopsis sp. NPDC059027]|uniref:ABC transporter permease n=1 Tax=unclassified Amycolatopsis TaxID=2618356 RepID=UPI00366E43CF